MSAQEALLRDKLLEVAKECAECSGTGCVDVIHTTDDGRQHSVTADCPACADIREVLQ